MQKGAESYTNRTGTSPPSDDRPRPNDSVTTKKHSRPKPAASTVAAAVDAALPVASRTPILPSDLREAIVPFSDTMRVACPAREALVEGMIDRGEIGTLAGVSGLGKTPLVQQLAVCVATGTSFLGCSIQEVCRVGLIDLESRPDRLMASLKRQATALGTDLDQVGQQLDVFVRGNPGDPNSRELDRMLTAVPIIKRWTWLRNIIAARQYGLVIIDTGLVFWPIKSTDEEKVRQLFSGLSILKNQPPYPAFLLTLHLRKPDRRATPPSLLEDPFAWTDEILGSRAWSTNADVRLGIDRLGQMPDDDRLVFSGFRRGEGALAPLILEPAIELLDGEPHVTNWQRCAPETVAATVLTDPQRGTWEKLPVGTWFTWSELSATTRMGKSSLSRFIKRATPAGLIERDASRYRRPVLDT